MAVVKMIVHFFAQVDPLDQAGDDHMEVLKRSVECRHGTLASWNFTFSVLSDCNLTLSPLSPDVWLFIPLRWRSVFQWAPCGAQEVTLGPADRCHVLSLLLPRTHTFYNFVHLSYF